MTVTSLHTGLRLHHRVLAGKFVMFGEDKMGAGSYFVSSKGIFVHKYPLILRYGDCNYNLMDRGNDCVVKRKILVVYIDFIL
jgi:hypothetical protein